MPEDTNRDAITQKPEPIEGLELVARVAPDIVRLTIDLDVNGGLVPPRKETLQNKVFTSMGGARLLQPDQEAVAQAVASCDKLKYFDVTQSSKFRESDAKRIGDYEFTHLIMEPLLDEIKRSFPDFSKLSFRGGMASINGTHEFEYGHSAFIPDVTEIVNKGGDREGVFNVATTNMDGTMSDHFSHLHRVVQYAARTAFIKAVDFEPNAPEISDTLFPIISVYDTSKLRKHNGNVWAVQAKEGYTESDALIATYILDCPM